MSSPSSLNRNASLLDESNFPREESSSLLGRETPPMIRRAHGDCSIATGADSKIARQEQGESTWDPLNASELAPNSANGLIPSLIAWAKSQSPGNIAIVSAHAAFQRDLPLLIKNHRHRWVAYHGDRRVAIGPSERQLFQQCHHQDLPPEEFMVRLIEAEIPEEIDWNESHDV